MQDINNLTRLIAERKGLTLEAAAAKFEEITKGKTLLGAKLAVNHYLDNGSHNFQTTLKGFYDVEPHERIKE